MWKPFIKTRDYRGWRMGINLEVLSITWMLWKVYKKISVTILGIEIGIKNNRMVNPQYKNIPHSGS